MPITRKAKITAIWTCHDRKGSKFKYHYVNVTIKQTYITRAPPEPNTYEDLNRWLDERAYTTIKRMCKRSCESLCDSCYCTEESIDYNIIEVPTQTGELEKPKVKPTVPGYIKERIDYLEQLYKEAETTDEKMAIREEIDKTKQRYGIE